MPGAGPAYCSVVLPVAVPRAFDYAIPPTLRGVLREGCRVRVPFGNRIAVGYCVALREEAGHTSPKPILEVLDAEPILDPHLVDLGRWIARRYAASWGEVLQAMLPGGVRGGVHSARHRVLKATAAAPRDADLEALDRKAPAQAKVMRLVLDSGGELPVARLASRERAAARALVERGWIEEAEGAPTPPDLPSEPEPPPPDLTVAQRDVCAAVLGALGSYRRFVLEGVTGSGKTEVYLRSLAETIRRGEQGLMLIPEIALTPQTERRIRARFERVAVLHSQLAEGDRAAAWRAAADGRIDVVVGARSAVFTPFRRLGLIVIDEEHEPSYKQDNKPRYDARAVADRRAQVLSIPLVVGSATPSLESFHDAVEGRSTLLRLPDRVAGGALPPVDVVDLRVAAADRKGWRVISIPLLSALRDALAEKRQAILFLNRRGYATAICCRRCGFVLRCRHCAVALVHHADRGRALCHYCAWSEPPPASCPECSFPQMALIGAGTERVAKELARFLPEARIRTFDADATRFRGAHAQILDAFRREEIDILVGTQMVAKGLDFPNVTVVGVISCDTQLHLPDLRAAERTFQLLAQVA
ncbi:MAG: primosomal protein N', partial [Planctomycetes bacterium]|nr:primosomal protein N' [Planctomycetota bacterium]